MARLIIADTTPKDANDFCKCILLNDFYSDKKNIVSIPGIIDAEPLRFRSIIIEWLANLPERTARGRRLRDYFKAADSFDYWSFSHLGQKFNAADNSPINLLVKIFALELEFEGEDPDLIVISTQDQILERVIKDFCKQRKIPLVVRSKSGSPLVLLKKLFLISGILFVKASGFFFLSLLPRAIKNTRKKKLMYEKRLDLVFFDVLIHLTDRHSKVFASNYWGKLIDVLAESRSKVAWFHLYHKHHHIQSIRAADSLLATFSANDVSASHRLLEATLSIGAVRDGVRDYLLICAKSYFFKAPVDAFWSPLGVFNVWPYLSAGWYDSARGPNGLQNCVWRHQFEEIISSINVKKAGVYLMENQPWEMALVAAWRKYQSARLIGVAHSTVRFWDLRYFHSRDRRLASMNSHQPDIIAVNGLPALDMMRESECVEEERLKLVEALRYLDAFVAERSPVPAQEQGVLSVLVCGDFSRTTSERLCSCLHHALQLSGRFFDVRFKPHPSQSYLPPNNFKFTLSDTDHSMAECLATCDIVLVSHISSTAVEAALANRYVISLLDVTLPNMSPYFRSNVVKFVYDSQGLAIAMAEFSSPEQQVDGYFNMNPDLSKWRELLSLPAVSRKRETNID